MIKAKFANEVIIYVARKIMKRGICNSGLTVNPKRTNSVPIESFVRAIFFSKSSEEMGKCMVKFEEHTEHLMIIFIYNHEEHAENV